jgi:hypothetical protein
VLFLRVQAAASYYTANRTLMDLNILPQSLGPVALYISAVAVGAWFLSGYIYHWLLSVAAEAPTNPHTD